MEGACGEGGTSKHGQLGKGRIAKGQKELPISADIGLGSSRSVQHVIIRGKKEEGAGGRRGDREEGGRGKRGRKEKGRGKNPGCTEHKSANCNIHMGGQVLAVSGKEP